MVTKCPLCGDEMQPDLIRQGGRLWYADVSVVLWSQFGTWYLARDRRPRAVDELGGRRQGPAGLAGRRGGAVPLPPLLVDLADELDQQVHEVGLLQVRPPIVDDLGDVVEPPVRLVAEYETVLMFQEPVAELLRDREERQIPGDAAEPLHLLGDGRHGHGHGHGRTREAGAARSHSCAPCSLSAHGAERAPPLRGDAGAGHCGRVGGRFRISGPPAGRGW
ncbi:hypothetical protein [Streptomyces peucetius]|uniref:Uncharacterized protein n=1 Tax=Streptomyces peucetius TaxID=1950 RepID=A0ABY6I3T2_STRPE|nr:hypothetical protein [Streptomyces peucetius]UYQ60664.1 hypothetical protein OGH68_03740 [Streptomyces peucetius]